MVADSAVAANHTATADGDREQPAAWRDVCCCFAVDCGAACTTVVTTACDINRLTACTAAIACGATAAADSASIIPADNGSSDVARSLNRNCRLRERDRIHRKKSTTIK